MNLSGMDLAQIQANGMQAIPGLDPTQLMNLLRHLPGVFTKVRPSISTPFQSTYLWAVSMKLPTPRPSFLDSKFRALLRLHVIVSRSSRLRVEHAASHDECFFGPGLPVFYDLFAHFSSVPFFLHPFF